jgi:hypothetical protein
MSPLTDRQLAKKLRPDSVAPEPPAGLLDELRRQIPAEVRAPAPADTGNLLPFRRPLPRRVWLAAASVAMLIGGGTLSWLALRHQVGLEEAVAEPPRQRATNEYQYGSPAEARDGSAGATQPRDRNALGYAGAPSAAPPASAPAYPGRFAEQQRVRGPARPAEVPSGGRADAASSAPMALAAPPPAAATRVAPLSQREQAALSSRGYVAGEAQQAVAPDRGVALRRAPAPAGGHLALKLRDDSGASLPGVTVTVKRVNEAPHVAVTDAKGEVSLAGLPPGQYRVEAELEGFDTTVYPTVAVNPERRTEIEAQLTTSVEDVMTATAESPLLDERRASSKSAKASTARDPWRILRSTPGVLTDRVNVGVEADAEGMVAAKQTAAPASAAGKPATSAAPAAAAAEAEAPAATVPAPEPVAPTLPPSTGGTREPNDQPHGDVFFKSDGTNPFVDSEDDRLSTFALDVDTGSYDVVRRDLQGGKLPPQAAVRVEGLVNAFDYGDPAPSKGDFALTAEAAPDPWAPGDRYLLVRFAVKAREASRSARTASATGAPPIVATEAHAQVEVDPRHVVRWRLVGAESGDVADARRGDALVAGAVAAGQAVTALYELELRPDVPPDATLAVLRLRWRPAAGAKVREIHQPLRRSAVVKRWESASRAFRLATIVGRFAEVLRGSYWAKPGAQGDDLRDLLRRVATVSESWSQQPRVAELVQLVARARELRQPASE